MAEAASQGNVMEHDSKEIDLLRKSVGRVELKCGCPKKLKRKRQEKIQEEEEYRKWMIALYQVQAQAEKRRKQAEAKKKMDEIEYFKEQWQSLAYVFNPMEGDLVDHFLRAKNLNESVVFCPIPEVVDMYADHPLNFTVKYRPTAEKEWYFFTRSRPNEIQPGTTHGNWVCGPKGLVQRDGQTVGYSRILNYYEGDRRSKIKMMEYELDPKQDNLMTPLWFLCKLYFAPEPVERVIINDALPGYNEYVESRKEASRKEASLKKARRKEARRKKAYDAV